MHELTLFLLYTLCLWPLLLTGGAIRANNARFRELLVVLDRTPILPLAAEYKDLCQAENAHRAASKRCDRIVLLAAIACILQFIALDQWL